MVSHILQRYLFVALVGQVTVSVLNSLFLLSDNSGAVAVIGLYGTLNLHPTCLLAFIVLNATATVVDALSLGLWTPYVLHDLLSTPSVLGAYFMTLTGLGIVIKLVALVQAYMLRSDVVRGIGAGDLLAAGLNPTSARFGEAGFARTPMTSRRRQTWKDTDVVRRVRGLGDDVEVGNTSDEGVGDSLPQEPPSLGAARVMEPDRPLTFGHHTAHSYESFGRK